MSPTFVAVCPATVWGNEWLSSIQEAINTIVDELEGIVMHIDDVVIGDATETQQGKNLAEFQLRAQQYNLTINAMSRANVFCSQLNESGYNAKDGRKNKKFIAGDMHFILREVHDKMGNPGISRTVEFIQRNFDVPSLKQKVQDYISKRSFCLELKPMFFKPPYTIFIRPRQT